MSRIRVKIKKIRPIFNGFLTIFRLFRNSHFDIKCLDSMIDGGENWKNPMILRFRENGQSNKDLKLLVIRFDEGWIRTAGIFALLNKTLCGLYFADRFGLIPLVDRWEGCPYQVGDDGMVFEYYFEPVSDMGMDEANDSYNVAYTIDSNFNLILRDFGTGWFSYSEPYIDRMASILSKYISFNEKTKGMMEKDIVNICNDFDSTLGVHFRGTDYKLNMNSHPVALNPTDYYDSIDRALETGGYDRIFLATDDLNAMKMFKERYGSRIVYYQDVFRADGMVSTAFTGSAEGRDGRRTGYEALRDSLTLSKCGGVIVGFSQVSIFAVINKRSRGESFKTFDVINKGINDNDKEWLDEFDYLVR